MMQSDFPSDVSSLPRREDAFGSAEDANREHEGDANTEEDELAMQTRGREAKTQFDEIISDFFVETMDVDGFVGDLGELLSSMSTADLPFDPVVEAIKRLVVASLDYSDRHRELASRVLASGSGVLFGSDEVIEAMAIVIARMGDLELDCPNVCDYLCRFLARAVADEVIPPKAVGPLSPLAPVRNGPLVLEAAAVLVKSPVLGMSMDRVWGVAAANDLPSIKKAVESCLEEMFVEGDVEECMKCVRDLRVSPYHHEVIKKAVVMALDRDERAQALVVRFFIRCAEENMVTPSQFTLGIHRLAESMEDIRLDAPHADRFVARLVATLREEGIVEAQEVEGALEVCKMDPSEKQGEELCENENGNENGNENENENENEDDVLVEID